jgi:hypothetical protein
MKFCRAKPAPNHSPNGSVASKAGLTPFLLALWASTLLLTSCGHRAGEFPGPTDESEGLRITSFEPAEGAPYSVAISPDGNQVAMMHRVYLNGLELSADSIEIHDVPSNATVKTLSLPRVDWTHAARQFSLSRDLNYCDRGKYLLAFTGPDILEIVDSQTFQIRHSLVFSQLSTHFSGAGKARRFDDINFLTDVSIACAASEGRAVLAFYGDNVASFKLIDLDRGQEIEDLVDDFHGRARGRGLAISPDGSKVARVSWTPGNDNGTQAEIVDVRTGSALRKTLELGGAMEPEYDLVFAGEDALVVAEAECQPGPDCETHSIPHARDLRVWFFAGDGGVRTLGWPGQETYRSFGASADGNRLFAYSGTEKRCASCNEGAGELKIDNARFTVWDRASGRVLVRSPTLKVETYTCGFHLGSCENYQQAPELQMSGDGKSLLAFWFRPLDKTPDSAPGSGGLEVFRLRN